MDAKNIIYKIAVTGFVPGLPAEISMEEAEALGVADTLRAAIKNGNYAASPTTDNGPRTIRATSNKEA